MYRVTHDGGGFVVIVDIAVAPVAE